MSFKFPFKPNHSVVLWPSQIDFMSPNFSDLLLSSKTRGRGNEKMVLGMSLFS